MKKSDNYEQYFSMCLAYIEIGEVAAHHENVTGEYQNAVAYQLYHALELFVKYAILKKTGHLKKTHDLSMLFDSYYKLYTNEIYKIEHPFDFTTYTPSNENLYEYEMYEKHIETFEPKIMDQHLRYPYDEKTGRYSYQIESSYFTNIRKTIKKIYGEINDKNY